MIITLDCACLIHINYYFILAIKDEIFHIPAVTSIKVREGESTQIGCLVNSRKEVTISWKLPDGIILGPGKYIYKI